MRFFELADDIRLIDIPPKELLQRLKEGKVYRPQQAQQALRGFFRQGNISALRELALRFTARHVDQDMLAYMRLHKIEGPWPASGKVMVCVSASPFSAQLIRAAQRLAQGLHAEFLAVHIETPERRFPQCLCHPGTGRGRKVSCHHDGSTAAAGRLAPVCRGAGGSCHYYWALLCFPRSAGAGQYILTVFAAGIVDSSLVGQKYGLCNSALLCFRC